MSTEHAAQTLTRLAQVLTETLDLSAVLARVAEAAVDLVPGSAARIWTVDGERLALSAEAGAVPSMGAAEPSLALGEGWVGHVARTLEPLVVTDGAYVVPDGPGLGAKVDEKRLEALRIG